MSRATLGSNIDIHTGGVDHITVHHSNEMLQSEHSFCTHQPRVRYRLHNQFLNIDGEKLAKSVGNAYTLPDIINQGYDPLDLRFMFFHAQYSNFQDFSADALTQARNARNKLRTKLAAHTLAVRPHSWQELKSTIQSVDGKAFLDSIEASLGNNLNTPELLAHIYSALKNPSEDIYTIIGYLDATLLCCDLFETSTIDDSVIPASIHALAEKRLEAKNNKEYERADELRKTIFEAGYTIQDTSDGYTLTAKTQ